MAKTYLIELSFEAKNQLLRDRLQQFLRDIGVTKGYAGVWSRTGVEVVRVKLTKTQYTQLYNCLPFNCGTINGRVLARNGVPYERPRELGWGMDKKGETKRMSESLVEKIKQMDVVLPHMVATSRQDKIRNRDYFQGMKRGFEQAKETVLALLECYDIQPKPEEWEESVGEAFSKIHDAIKEKEQK